MLKLQTPTFEQSLAAAWPPSDWADLSVVLAVSGGPDSVAMLCGMAARKAAAGGAGRVIVAHLNHHLRPEADDDATFVADLARQLDLPVEIGSAQVARLSEQQGDGVEAAARTARLDFLRQTAERVGARYVATAHTADDQVETVLFNILRGTGLAGLAGIPRVRMLGPAVSLVRPMLEISRAAVLRYLAEIRQPYREDPTNRSADFTRNRIRHELLPLLRDKYNPDISSALERLAELAGDAQRLIEESAEDLLDRCLGPLPSGSPTAGNPIRLCLAPIKGVNRHLVREMFVALWRQLDWPQQNMGFAQWDSLADLALLSVEPNATVKRSIPAGVLAIRDAEHLALQRT